MMKNMAFFGIASSSDLNERNRERRERNSKGNRHFHTSRKGLSEKATRRGTSCLSICAAAIFLLIFLDYLSLFPSIFARGSLTITAR